MKEKCCKNCLHFKDLSYSTPVKNADGIQELKWTRKLECDFHGDGALITFPEGQFCGDKVWESVKRRHRDNLLTDLGI